MPLVDKLLKNIESMKGSILSGWEAGHIANRIKDGMAEFRVPETVSCKFESDYKIGLFWCPVCGAISHWQEAGKRGFKCTDCGSELAQCYVFAPYFYDKPQRAPHISDLILLVWQDENSYCSVLKTHKRLKRDDRERPVESLSWFCPDAAGKRGQCRDRDSLGFCNRQQRTWGGIPTRNGHVRLYKPRALLSKLGTSIPFRYSPALPSEGLTRAIQIGIHSFKERDAQELSFHRMLLPGVESIAYVRNLLALNFSLAVAVGFTTAPLYSRTVIFNEEEDAEGRKRLVILARRLNTRGMVIRLKPVLFEEISDDPAAAGKLLHTVSHAFLKHLPLKAGLEPNEFYESLDVEKREIAIYDNQPGGIGGVETVVDLEASELDSDYQHLVSDAQTCDLDCPSACKACLYVENCGRLNRQLNRHLLEGVIASE
jgi:hypothetical protein